MVFSYNDEKEKNTTIITKMCSSLGIMATGDRACTTGCFPVGASPVALMQLASLGHFEANPDTDVGIVRSHELQMACFLSDCEDLTINEHLSVGQSGD